MAKSNKKTGTRQWSKFSENFQIGCENKCRYCYARYNAIFGRFPYATQEQWDNPVINQKKIDTGRRKKEGVIMFPTTHDITPRNLSEYLCVLRKLLDAGNRVLIVSKPHWECITVICDFYDQYREQIEFRFTIGSTDDKVLSFWEPNAPSFEERLCCLKYAHAAGYKTSVSCEPYLDPYVVYTYTACLPYITETFWIGKLNKFEQRVNLDGATAEQIKKFVEPLKAAQSDSVVKSFHRMLNGQRGIMWKESITGVVGK